MTRSVFQSPCPPTLVPSATVPARLEDPSERLPVFPEDRFVEVTKLGAGANATVFRAFDCNLRRRVALKVSTEHALLDGADRERMAEFGAAMGLEALIDEARADQGRYTLLREARLLARVNHPNVIPVIEVGRLGDGAVAVIMPLLSGGALPDQLRVGRWQALLELALQIGEGLAAIHEAGLLHRDLKPANVLLDEHGRPQIADLGLACEIQDAEAMAERVGTPRYMAPETLRGEPRDQRDDLYAYCMIVWELLYGHSPFASLEARLAGEVSDIRRAGGMSAELREVLVEGLHCDPDKRWPDMPTLLTALRGVSSTSRPRRRWGWGWAAVGVAAVLALGVIGSTIRRAQADACEQAAAELGQLWNDELHAELETLLGTRMAGDALQSWVGRWASVRATQCAVAKRAGRSLAATACLARMRDQFQATVETFQAPGMREDLRFAVVIAELPAPEHCLDQPDEGEGEYGRLAQLLALDVEVGARVRMGDLDSARTRQQHYMALARALLLDDAIARALFWHAEILRLEGRLEQAEQELGVVYTQAQQLGAALLGAEATMGLVAIAGARGDIAAADAYALLARGVFMKHQPERVAQLDQVQGLALVSGPEQSRARGLELLAEAIALREAELRSYGGTRELLSQAHESYASGLLMSGREAEALEYLARAQDAHQTEFGHGTWRTHGIQRQRFLGMLRLGRLAEAEAVEEMLVQDDVDRENWPRLTQDVLWLAAAYVDAAHPRHAAGLLHTAKSIAVARRLVGPLRRFDLELAKLEER